MRPQWRGQPFGTFKVLFNASLYSASVAAQTPDNAAFWAKPAGEAEGEGRWGVTRASRHRPVPV